MGVLQLALVFIVACSAAPLASRAIVLDDVSQLSTTYDYLIIGGGTSGLTVANRLTENPNVTVLVIEAGPLDPRQLEVIIPGLQTPPEYTITYTSTPQPGLNNRTSPLLTARVVGGASVHNGMFFTRGSMDTYNAWETLGNPGWTWDGLLPYFKKSEKFTPAPDDLTSQYPISNDLTPHGTHGPIQSGFSRFQWPVIKFWFSGWNSIGIPSNPQPNAGTPNGAFYSALSIDFRNQSRSSADIGSYRKVVGRRPNYHLITEHLVTKILFDHATKTATGVQFVPINGSTVSTVSARRECILAAGSVHTAQILQLSGIGPQSLLSSLGIPTLVNLPVGYNFQDQPSFFALFTYGPDYPFPSPDLLNTNQTFADEQLDLWFSNRTGAYTIPFASGSIVYYLGLQNFTNSTAEIIAEAAAVNLSSVLPPGAGPLVLAGYEAQQSAILDIYRSPTGTVQESAYGGTAVVPIVVLQPLSRGTILINSTDPFAAPVINYNTFAHPTDLRIFVEAFKKNRAVMQSPPFQEIETQETFPGPTVITDDAIAAAIRSAASSTWQHPSGTASMMKREYGGVVDAKLRVYGVKNLRIVDASIFPIIPATHTSPSVYAVAEKAADIIKGAHLPLTTP